MKSGISVVILAAGVALLGFSYGCGGKEPEVRAQKPAGSQARRGTSSQPAQPISDDNTVEGAAMAEVESSSPQNWDADPADDGISIYPKLTDSKGETIKYENKKLDVDIEIWTKEGAGKNGRKLAGLTGTTTSWEDGSFTFNKGIRVPFALMKTTETDGKFGVLDIKIHANGQVYEATKKMGVVIEPEPK